MKTNLIVFAFLLMLVCQFAQSQKTKKNPTSKNPNQTSTVQGKPSERQESKFCGQGTSLKFKPSDDKILLANPERGFYHFHEIKLYRRNTNSQEKITLKTSKGITLALLIFDIEAFVKTDLSQDALKRMTGVFKTLRSSGMKGIVRFSYNYTDIGDYPDKHSFPQTTDAQKPQLLKHISQLKSIFMANVDVINALQIGFIGHWGEWYYSKNYATQVGGGWKPNVKQETDRKEIVKALMKAVPKDLMLQIRYPLEKQKIYGKGNTKPDYARSTEASRLGIHSDCFLATKDDMGTFTDKSQRTWLEKEGLIVMVGGETCQTSKYTGCSEAEKQIEKQRFTYLNTDFHKDVIKTWESKNCYKKIGNKIGYRFVFVEGKLQSTVKKGSSFCGSLKINNTGTAPLYNYRPVEVILRNEIGKKWSIAEPNIDPRKFIPAKVTTVQLNVRVPSDASPGKYDVILNLPDKKLKDIKHRILFVNGGKVQDKNERFNVIGQITISP